VTDNQEYAGFWRRFAAYTIDWAVLSVVLYFLFNLIFFEMRFGASWDDARAIAVILLLPISTMLYWCYFSGMESSPLQGTIGKLAVGLYVTDLQGQRISFGRATGRHFGKFLSGLILSIGYIMAGFTKKKQGLHDIIASCLVLRK